MSKETLNSKFNVQDPLHISDYHPSLSPYGYKGYVKFPNFEREIQQINPVSNGPALNSSARFTFPKRSTYIGQHQLVATLSAVTANGGGTACCVDFVGFRLYPLIQYRFASNMLQQLDYITLHLLHKLFKRKEAQVAEAVLVRGNLSIAERESLAAGTQKLYTDIPCFWTHHHSLFLNRDALSHDLELNVTLASAGDITQGTSGTTPTVTLSDLYVRTQLHHVEDNERDDATARTLSGVGEVKSIRDFELQTSNVIAGGQANYQINLSLMKGLVSDFRFVFRRTTALTSPGTISNKPFEYVRFDDDFLRWEIKASGIQVVSSEYAKENLFIHNAQDHTAMAGVPAYGYSASHDSEDFMNSTGHHNYGGFSSPILYLYFASDPGPLTMDIWTLTYNTIQQVKGEIVKNFL